MTHQEVSAVLPTGDAPQQFPIAIAEWSRNVREVIRIALDCYNGCYTINTRVWYRRGADLKPTKSGLSVSVEHLPALAEAFAAASDAAHTLGLIVEQRGRA